MIKNCLPPTTKRVSQATHPSVNAKIRTKTIQNITLYKDSSKELISERIKKLDYEWDTERLLETNASLLIIMSSAMGLSRKKCWCFISGMVGAFLLQHALMGWCPPLLVIRKAGVRTSEEIIQEKMVLKKIRGDFQENDNGAEEMLINIEK